MYSPYHLAYCSTILYNISSQSNLNKSLIGYLQTQIRQKRKCVKDVGEICGENSNAMIQVTLKKNQSDPI